MIINVHAGHNMDGKRACGAIGIVKESTVARQIKDLVISKLKALGHTVYDCTVDDALTQSLNLYGIVKKCNAHTVDLDVSIHLNAGGGQGCEVLVYDMSKNSPVDTAKRVALQISNLGFRNRGVKARNDLYVLAKTKAPAMLIETFFCDSPSDCELFNAEAMANAIVKGITGKTVTEPKAETKTETVATIVKAECPFVVKVLVSDLNIRKGAGATYDVVGQVRKGTKYTIVQTSGNWGKLKSGAGWIYLSSQYVERA